MLFRSQILRKFISYHGVDVLKTCLDANIDSRTICRHQILLALKKLPIASKNIVLKSEGLVKRMCDADIFGAETSQIATDLLESWESLQMVYRIPKRVEVFGNEKSFDGAEADVSSQTLSSQSSFVAMNLKWQNSRESIVESDWRKRSYVPR